MALTLDHLQQREDHWAIVYLVGKGAHGTPLLHRTRLFRASDELTGSNPLWTMSQDWPLENLLIKWRSHASCGFNLSTVCLL